MEEHEKTFGKFIRHYRLNSEKELTLNEVSKILDMSLTMYSDIEKDRRNPADDFKFEKLIALYGLSEEETATMYDLAGRKRRMVPPDIEDIMMNSESGNLARMALRMTKSGVASEEDWKEFIRQLEEKKRRG